MNINEASELLKRLISESYNKSEIKVYQSFLNILSALKNRELTPEEMRFIEEKLDELKLTAYADNRKKYLKRKLNEFKKYLTAEFSLITEGYYTAIGMSLGMTFGVALGQTIFGADMGIGLGISIGMLIGLIIGRNLDAKAEKQGRVLKT